MFHTIVLLFLVGVAGIIVGAIGHAFIAEKAAATKVEIADWALRLKGAVDADYLTAKGNVLAVAKDIEKKL